MKKTFTSLLAILLLLTNISTCIIAEDEESPNEVTESTVLEMEDLDPSTLNVHKLGELEDEEEELEEFSLPYSQNDTVRVSIVLDGKSTLDAGYSTKGFVENQSAVAYRDQLKQQQFTVQKSIESKLNKSLDVKWNLTLAVNIISANVKYSDINKIKLVSGVKDVVIENRYDALEDTVADPNTANTSTYMVGATETWESGYSGAGPRIAIIDTGIDTNHQSFNADAFMYSINFLFDQSTSLI